MIPANPVKFSVVREDPQIDIDIINQFSLKKLLLVCSGGCTALSIASTLPNIDVDVFDPNSSQLARTQQKMAALISTEGSDFYQQFSIGDEYVNSLNSDGQFESLFRQFRLFLWEFVADKNEWMRLFNDETLSPGMFEHPFWPVAFELFFHAPLLETMFGPAAIQHAPRGSYPSYFRRRLENGLLSSSRVSNYFLHHLFLGHYLDECAYWPPYLQAAPCPLRPIQSQQGYLADVPSLETYDYIMLSNIFDWMDDDDFEQHCTLLEKMQSGAILLFRQLNNDNPRVGALKRHFIFHNTLADTLIKQDRSLFYNAIVVAERK